MVKGLYGHIREMWRKPRSGLGKLWQERLVEWRKMGVVERVDRPTRLDRARALGYKAKKGFIVIRVRLKRGGRKRPRPIRKGRKSRKQSIRKVLKMSYQWVAEQRAARRYVNCEVLGSYWVGKDGKHYFYEVILIDRAAPEIVKDKHVGWVASGKQRGRVFRGKTSAGRKSRGLRKKGKGAEKVRPSLRVHLRRGK